MTTNVVCKAVGGVGTGSPNRSATFHQAPRPTLRWTDEPRVRLTLQWNPMQNYSTNRDNF